MLLTHVKFEFDGLRRPSNSNLTWGNIFFDPTLIRAVKLFHFQPWWDFFWKGRKLHFFHFFYPIVCKPQHGKIAKKLPTKEHIKASMQFEIGSLRLQVANWMAKVNL